MERWNSNLKIMPSKFSAQFLSTNLKRSIVRGIERLPNLLQDFSTQINGLTGWTITILAGGPDPVDGGNIRTVGYHLGRDTIGNNFANAYPTYRESILKPYSAFVHNVFRMCNIYIIACILITHFLAQETRDKRALPAPENETSIRPFASVSTSGTHDTTVSTSIQANKPGPRIENSGSAGSFDEPTMEASGMPMDGSGGAAADGDDDDSGLTELDVSNSGVPAAREANAHVDSDAGDPPVRGAAIAAPEDDDGPTSLDVATVEGGDSVAGNSVTGDNEREAPSETNNQLQVEDIGDERTISPLQPQNHLIPDYLIDPILLSLHQPPIPPPRPAATSRSAARSKTQQNAEENTDICGPRRRKKAANKEIVPLTERREVVPEWLENAREYLQGDDESPAWQACLDAWMKFEQDLGYNDVTSVSSSEVQKEKHTDCLR